MNNQQQGIASDSFTAKDYFENLGRKTEKLWKTRDYDERAFPEVAERVLLEDPPSENVSFWDAVKYAFFTDPLPYQFDLEASFGQPPVTVYWHHDFRIELLFWVEALPDIHEHSFSGAFHVMHGSSLHVKWEFESEQRLVTKLLIGKVRPLGAELLKKGNTRAIRSGRQFIHATYHLDRPSISVVVRTNQEADRLPQYGYAPPYIAHAAIDLGPVVKRRTQMIQMLVRAGRYSELLEVVLHFLETADVYSVFHCVMETYLALRDETDRNRLLLAAERRHPALIEAMRPVLLAWERRSQVIALRRLTTNPDLQFFLGLLLNVPYKEAIIELILARQQRSKPVDWIIGWIEELSQLNMLDPKLPEGWKPVLREMLSASEDQVLRRLTQKHLIPPILFQHWLLAPLFASSSQMHSAPEEAAEKVGIC